MDIRQIIAQALNHGGVTYDVRSNEIALPIDAWYYPAHPGLTKIVPVDALTLELTAFMNEYETELRQPKNYLGLWISPDTGYCYIDITTMHKNQSTAYTEAIRLSTEQGRSIVSIFNPIRKKTIYLPKTK